MEKGKILKFAGSLVSKILHGGSCSEVEVSNIIQWVSQPLLNLHVRLIKRTDRWTHYNLIMCTQQFPMLRSPGLDLLHGPHNLWIWLSPFLHLRIHLVDLGSTLVQFFLQLCNTTLQPLNVLFKRLFDFPHFAPVSPQNKVVEKQVDDHSLGTLQLPRVEINRHEVLQLALGGGGVCNLDHLRSRRLRSDLAAHLLQNFPHLLSAGQLQTGSARKAPRDCATVACHEDDCS